MNALVTGKGGFIGTHLCRRLTAEGWAFIEEPQHVGHPRIDAIFHLAALVRTAPSIAMPVETMRANVVYSAKMFELGRRLDIPVVYSSSAVIYSPIVTPYQISKIAADSLAQFYNDNGGNIRIMRLAGVYGPSMKNGPIATWREQFRKNRVIDVWEGTQRKDYLYISDAVDALMLALETPSGVFDICSGIQTELLDFAKLLNVPYRLVAGSRLVAEELRQNPSGSWRPKVSLEEGMAEVRKEFQ